MIIFENPGELDIRALRTFGVSVKEHSNPIGFFGTGLKYAIAVLLREGQSITVLSGKDTYRFSSRETNIRGSSFSIITMNGEELGFTTSLGKTWKLWMAYRELYCNALDENGKVYESSTFPSPTPNRTFIVVEGNLFHKVHQDRSSFILSSKPIETFPSVEVHPSRTTNAFFRGINVGQVPYPGRSYFTYNALSGIDLTEDRLLKWGFQFRNHIARAILSSNSPSFITQALTCGEDFIEHSIDLSSVEVEPSPTFLEVVPKLLNNYSRPVNPSVRDLVKTHQLKTEGPREMALTPVEEKMLARALSFAEALHFPISRYPIKCVETLGRGILGLAKDGTIYVTREVFDSGTKMLAGTLIEEFIHLAYELPDESRGMQNFLLNRLISLGEELRGEPI